MKMLRKPAASALPWVAGGSSSRPRLGKPLLAKRPAGKEKNVRGPHQSCKRGALLLVTRSTSKPIVRKVPYTPPHQQSLKDKRDTRRATAKSSVRLQTILNMSQKNFIKFCLKTKWLRKHAQCFHCKQGALTPFVTRKGRKLPQQRCKPKTRGSKTCRKYTYPHHGSPVFHVSDGSAAVEIQKQGGILHCAVWGVPQRLVSALIEGVGEDAVTSGYKKWRCVVTAYVKANQSKIKFGQMHIPAASDNVPVDEYEGDEAVFRKRPIGKKKVRWLEGVGLKRRGDRKSLVVKSRAKKHSVSARAENGRAVPPPYTADEWSKMNAKHIGKHALGHFDGAPAYKKQRRGQLRDAVPHSGPNKCYTKTYAHRDCNGKTFKAVGGTQSLDGWWGHAKKAVSSVNARFEGEVWNRVHEEQWQHWCGNEDRWIAAGRVLEWAATELK